MEIEGVEFNVLRAFHHELRVDALAWSPESHLDRIPTIRYGHLLLRLRPHLVACYTGHTW